MKKMEWMVAAGTVAALAGSLYSAGCVRTASDCALLGTCGEGGGTSTASVSTAATTSASASTTASVGSSSASSTSSSGTGGMLGVTACDGKRFGDTGNQAARTIQVDQATGNILLAGEFQGTLVLGGDSVTAAANDVFVATVDSSWNAKSLHSFAVPYGAVIDDHAGGFILAGSYSSIPATSCLNTLSSGTDLYVARVDGTGACLWAKGFNAPSAHVSLAVAASGEIALAGDAIGTIDFDSTAPGGLSIPGGGKRDLFLAKLDGKTGTVISAIGYGGSEDDVINGVAFDAGGGAILTGTFKSAKLDFGTGNLLKNATAGEQAFALRTGGSGSGWSVQFTGAGEQRPTAIAIDGTVALLAGDFTDTLGTLTSKAMGRAFFLIGLDTTDGKTKWGKSFDGIGEKSIKSIATSADGVVALTGSLDGEVDFGLGKLTSKGGAVVASLDMNGNAKSSRAFGVADPTFFASGVGLRGKKLYVAGAFSGTLDVGDGEMVESVGGTDVFVATLCLP